jgi:predicted dehydrogenase
MADAAAADNPRVRWRFDPKQAGIAAVTVDCGIHAQHMACFVTGQRITSVSSDFAHGIKSRELEDDALSAFRMSGDIIGRLWTSGLAIGRTHGLTLQVFGEQGGLRWTQEQPNQLYWTPLNGSTRILERGATELSAAAARANRLTVGHGEGMVPAFANIYRDLADVIASRDAGTEPDPLALDYPSAEDGLHSIEVVQAMVQSAHSGGRWIDVGA